MVRGQWANLARMPGLDPYSFFTPIEHLWGVLKQNSMPKRVKAVPENNGGHTIY